MSEPCFRLNSMNQYFCTKCMRMIRNANLSNHLASTKIVTKHQTSIFRWCIKISFKIGTHLPGARWFGKVEFFIFIYYAQKSSFIELQCGKQTKYLICIHFNHLQVYIVSFYYLFNYLCHCIHFDCMEKTQNEDGNFAYFKFGAYSKFQQFKS